jgi:hypothetical protein
VTVFLVIGGVGLAILLLSLVFGQLLDGAFDALDGVLDGIDLDVDGGSFLSGPVLGAFLGAFGLGGAVLSYTTSVGPVLATIGGVANGLVVGWLAVRLTRAFINMPTDEPVRVDDLLGKSGRVVTTVPVVGYGEVVVRHAGQRMKLAAQADTAIAVGTEVVVIEVLSTSAVKVTSEDMLFGLDR